MTPFDVILALAKSKDEFRLVAQFLAVAAVCDVKEESEVIRVVGLALDKYRALP